MSSGIGREGRRGARPGPGTIAVACAAAALGASIAIAVGHALADVPLEQWRLSARYTARFSFPILLVTFVASSWHRLAPSAASRFVLLRRRALGLAFATAHTIHLGALVTFNVMAGQVPNPTSLIGGGGAYLLMFAMAATSNDASVRRLGRNWVRLHKLGIYWLWFVFTISYGGRALGGKLEFAPFVVLLLGGLGLRIAAARARKDRRVEDPALPSTQEA
jgi:DMSO/TMAO reductase YedYZ heme-binding membrane subunit